MTVAWVLAMVLAALSLALFAMVGQSVGRWSRMIADAQASLYESLKERDRLFAEMTVYQAVLARLGRAVDLEWRADGELTATVRAATQAEMAAAADAGDAVH